MEATRPDCITDAPWSRKHDKPGTSLSAPAICYPTSLEELIELCRTTPERMHAAGSHWGLSTAAISDHTFIETHDPANQHRAMARTLFDVIPGCMTEEFLDTMALHHPVRFEHNKDDETPYFVHVETGKRIYELYAELDQDADADPRSLASHLARTRGNHDYSGPWAFRTLGSAGGQTVFGALTTGTHGGDFDRPPIADDVAALHLVVAGGKHFWIEPAVQPEDLPLTDDAALESVYAIDRYGGEENFEIVRDDKVFRAKLEGAPRRINRGECCDHYDHRFGRYFAHAGEQFDAVYVGHLHVRDYEVVDILPHEFKGARAVLRFVHDVAFALQD